jgi:hypothetical protein
MRSQPLVPPTPPRPVAPGHLAPPRTPPVRPQTLPRRPTSPVEGVVVARPAVVIGAPSQVIGGPLGESGQHRRGHGREPTPPPAPPESIFGQDLISEKSLDEVIMAYLSEDSGED